MFEKISNSNIYYKNLDIKQDKTTVQNPTAQNNATNPLYCDNLRFKGNIYQPFMSALSNSSADATKMYNELNNNLDVSGKRDLDILLKTGKLLSTKSNDGSTTLENLYKVMKEPRAEGLNSKVILNETIKTLVNPYIITQKFGKISPQLKGEALKAGQIKDNMWKGLGFNKDLVQYYIKAQTKRQTPEVTNENMEVPISGCCVAASTEFNLADKQPAEFARFVAGLSSPEMKVNRNIKYNNINPNLAEASQILNTFEVEHNPKDWNNVEVTLRPDKNAIIRAANQNNYRQTDTRSSIDVLLQSTFMQLGSQNTYNSLIDKRGGYFSTDDMGLAEIEKQLLETIVDNDGLKASVVYQNVDVKNFEVKNIDENNRYLGSKADYNQTFNHLNNLLDNYVQGVSVVTADIDANNTAVNMKEFKIVKAEKEFDGKTSYIYHDGNGNYSKINAEELIPKIYYVSNLYLKNHQYDKETIKKQLLDTINSGSNIIIGITATDGNGNINGGHEMTITGAKYTKEGKLVFIYNDTDDYEYKPLEMDADVLIPQIHHAGIPEKLLSTPPQTPKGVAILSELINKKN